MTIETKDWYAWINALPPKPDDFHVVGKVLVGNPGVLAHLCVRQPQGFNPSILLLDLHLVQQPGIWPQVQTWIQARFDEILTPASPKYTGVEVFYGGESIANIPVETVH